jgi:hypothetical protein
MIEAKLSVDYARGTVANASQTPRKSKPQRTKRASKAK